MFSDDGVEKYLAMVAKFLDLNKLQRWKYVEGKKTKELTCMTLR